MSGLHPWLQGQWRQLCQAREQGRMPHALLLSGPRGVGKGEFAEALARALLCRVPDPQGQACGQCPSCRQWEAGSSPDFLRVVPEEEGKAIKVDQVRELCAGLTLTSHGGGYKVALLRPAERMNLNAANSLLKTLEEPTANTVLLLVTERPAQLPATIRSRCQLLVFPAPPRAEALAWLADQAAIDAQRAGLLLDLSAGAPLQALALAADEVLEQRAAKLARLEAVQTGREDPLRVAADWSQEADRVTLAWMQEWIGDMIRITLGGDSAPVRNADLRDRLQGMAGRSGPAMLFAQLDRVTAAARMSASGVNRQLMMEDLLLPWAQGAQA
ncbi:MAG: DNA polymerase III subunit delta' [Gammaproteobacteria bacterium]|nr:DNA polymerase III subunit delta' [Gammaproteobacteria bacterium]